MGFAQKSASPDGGHCAAAGEISHYSNYLPYVSQSSWTAETSFDFSYDLPADIHFSANCIGYKEYKDNDISQAPFAQELHTLDFDISTYSPLPHAGPELELFSPGEFDDSDYILSPLKVPG